jgi:hypothetical protein
MMLSDSSRKMDGAKSTVGGARRMTQQLLGTDGWYMKMKEQSQD